MTQDGLNAVADIASRHGFGREAAAGMLESLALGNGAQAQFSHPEFGGMGQWSRGGMIMIGDMFNQNLKYRVDALCNDLSGLLANEPSLFAPVASHQSQSQGGGVSLFVGGSSSWWPAELGQPASSGAQNDMRYAFFPGARRLAIQYGGKVRVYDSGDHQLFGFSQQQGGGQSLTFNSQHGTIRVADLPRLDTEGERAAPAPSPQAPFAAPHAPAPQPRPAAAPRPPAETQGAPLAVEDILKTIERLASLRQNGVLTEEEFAAKKAELLGRI